MNHTVSAATILGAGTPALVVPPYPARPERRLNVVKHLATMRENVIAVWTQRAYEDGIIRGRLFGTSSFILNTPAAIKHVLMDNAENYTRTPAAFRVLRPILGEGLLLSEGKTWRHQRRTLAPAFTPRAVSHLQPHMLSAVNETIDEMRGSAGRDIDLREVLQRMTLEIAGRTMFSKDMHETGKELRGFVHEYGMRLAKPDPFDLLLPAGWPTPSDFFRARFRKRWLAFITGLIEQRQRDGKSDAEAPRDLFDLMVTARDPESGEAFSTVNLADQIGTMIIAGHETTATALFWAMYMLTLDPAAQEQVAAEAQTIADDEMPDMARLPFTRAVLDETMRLYPPAFLIARAPLRPDVLDGMDVAPGDSVLIAPWLLHRQESLWDQPNAFMPQRFLPGAPPIDRFAYMPFGVGPRVCIGAHFALVEATIALSRIIRNFRVSMQSDKPVFPVGVVTTQPSYSPMFRLTVRS